VSREREGERKKNGERKGERKEEPEKGGGREREMYMRVLVFFHGCDITHSGDTTGCIRSGV